MKTPGFTAEASVYKTSEQYQSIAMQAYSNCGQRVISQLTINPFSVSLGLGIFGGIGRSLCRGLCYIAWVLCLEGCEGTPENPKGSTHCIICDENYRECLKGCSPTRT